MTRQILIFVVVVAVVSCLPRCVLPLMEQSGTCLQAHTPAHSSVSSEFLIHLGKMGND